MSSSDSSATSSNGLDLEVQKLSNTVTAIQGALSLGVRNSTGIKDHRLRDGWQRLGTSTSDLVDCFGMVDLSEVALYLERINRLILEGDQLITILRPKRFNWKRFTRALFSSNSTDSTDKKLAGFDDDITLNLDIQSTSTRVLSVRLQEKVQRKAGLASQSPISFATPHAVNATEMDDATMGLPSDFGHDSAGSDSSPDFCPQEVSATADVLRVTEQDVTLAIRLSTGQLSQLLGCDVDLSLAGDSNRLGEGFFHNESGETVLDGESILRVTIPRPVPPAEQT